MSEGRGGPEGRAGRRLLADRFLVLRQLGQGGMGRVWLAADETLGRIVAIKELRPPGGLAADGTYRERALREARSAAGVRHPNAVTLYEVLSVPGDDASYLIMEYVDGPTLGQLIDSRGALPAPAVARYGLQLLGVLAAAHALGIVHRDVKPDNILIAPGDQAKLTDFGIAYSAGDPRLSAGAVFGTRAYLAPELFDANPITPAADLWSLGATLYHAAEGRGAFDRESSGPMLRAILVDDIPAPSCEPHLARAIGGLLRREPGERATMGQAGDLLRQVPGLGYTTLHDQPPVPPADPSPDADPHWDPSRDTTVRPPTDERPPPRRPPEEPRGRFTPGWRWVAVAVGVAVLVGGTVGAVLAARAPGGTPAAEGSTTGPTATGPSTGASSPGAPGTGTAPAPGASAPATGTAGASSGHLLLSKTLSAPVGASGIAYSADGSMLASYGAADDSEATLLNTATRQSITLPFGPHAPDAAFSSGQTVAVAEEDGGIGVWDTATQNRVTQVSDLNFATGIAFNPDNPNQLAVGDSDGVRLLTVSTGDWGTPLPGAPRHSGPWTVRYSPNGENLAAVDQKTGYVYVWNTGTDAEEGSPIAPPSPGDLPGLGTSIGFLPGNGLLAIGSRGAGGTFPGVRYWDVGNEALLSPHDDTTYPGIAGVNALALDPNPRVPEDLAVGGTNGYVYLWDVPTGAPLGHPLDPGSAEIADLVFSPDGSTIAVLDVNDNIFLWTVTGVGD